MSVSSINVNIKTLATTDSLTSWNHGEMRKTKDLLQKAAADILPLH